MRTPGRPLINANVTLYALRHTCATLLLLAGESAKVIGERLGHGPSVMTPDAYPHALPSVRQAAEKLEKMPFAGGV